MTELDSPGTCPTCGTGLQTTTHESVSIDACPAGHGCFIGADALSTAVRDRTSDRPEHEERSAEAAQSTAAVKVLGATQTARPCPVCSTPMQMRIYAYESGVAVDTCSEHGVWLDQGELERIEAWHEAQERHRDTDRETWGGDSGKLEQIEQQYERKEADDEGSVHWGPIGRALTAMKYAALRSDDTWK